MSNKIFAFVAFLLIGTFGLNAQNSLQDLQKELEDTKTSLADLETKRLDLEKRIEQYDLIGWKFGGTGAANFTMAGFSNWIVGAGDNNATLGGNVNLYGNNNQEKYFWNNGVSLRLGYINNTGAAKLSEVTGEAGGLLDGDNWARNIDEIYISSLFGYKLSPVLAVSVLADARTSFANFFDPAIVSAGVGLTYKPNADLTVVFHPLTFRGIFASSEQIKVGYENWEDLEKNLIGDLGAKIVIDYKRELARNLVWTTNLSAFLAYADFGNPEITWLNDFGYKFNDFLTLNLHYGLRYYKPESYSGYVNEIANGYVNDDDETLYSTADLSNIKDYAYGTITSDELTDLLGADSPAPSGAFTEKFLQQKYFIGVGFTTTFDITKFPTIPLIND